MNATSPLFLGLPRRFASEVPMFFTCKITNSATRGRKCYNFETVKGRNLKFGPEVGHTRIILGADFEGSQSSDTVFRGKRLKCQSKVQTVLARKLIAGGEKVSTLQAPGHAVSAPKNKS